MPSILNASNVGFECRIDCFACWECQWFCARCCIDEWEKLLDIAWVPLDDAKLVAIWKTGSKNAQEILGQVSMSCPNEIANPGIRPPIRNEEPFNEWNLRGTKEGMFQPCLRMGL